MHRVTMHRTDGTFPGFNGLPLYYQCWREDDPRNASRNGQPKAKPKAIIALVHGLGGHSGFFKNIFHALAPQGYVLYALDLRGHGRSPGQRGYINRWDEFRQDIDCFISFATERELKLSHEMRGSSDDALNQPLPCVLMGHSLGGAISLDYAIRHPNTLAGVVAIAPALGVVGIPPLKMAIGKILSNVWPGFTLHTGINDGAASRDPAIISQYQSDPLRHTRGTARLATEFIATAHWIHDHADQLASPLLILQGTADQVSLPEGSDRFFQNVQFPDKTRYEYDGGYHDLHNDTIFGDVLDDLSHWLEGQISAATLPSACPISV
ncbi:MAG: alpha/beta hydrolase [Merismopedia sp. SIO2A8]|nr:alpha/beta hydrolase [Merismopedia sp. SIO2A8]